jgi:acyl-CoA thioesterase FadM
VVATARETDVLARRDPSRRSSGSTARPDGARNSVKSAGMGQWLETYRGTVHRWEVDNVDHFTVAYYFQRFEEATAALLAAAGLEGSGDRARGVSWLPAACRVHYLRELRAADILHVRSGVVGLDDEAVMVGHQVFDSGNGDLCTTVELTLRSATADGRSVPLGATTRRAIEGYQVAWEGFAREGFARDGQPDTREETWPDPGDPAFVDSARDLLKPGEVNAAGRATLAAYIHRFSAANAQALAAFGMTPAYMRETRRGFSTFEFRLRFGAPLRQGDLVRVQSAVRHVGNSSLRLVHRMTGGGGDLAAVLVQSGVHLDLEARRPAPLPAPLRDRALARLAGPSPAPGSAA